MKFRVSLLPGAEEEIAEAFDWYFERSPFAADAFRSEVISAVDSLAEDPLMWPADPEAVRPSESTGDREACARSTRKHLGVRVERPVSPHGTGSRIHFLHCSPRAHSISGSDYDTALRDENAHKADREQEFNRGAH